MKKTPMVDRWMEELGRHLAPRGRKAELARHLQVLYGSTERHWQNRLQVYLKRTETPSAETLLAIDRWLDVRFPPKPENPT